MPNDRLVIKPRKRIKSSWMKGFVIASTKIDDLAQSQLEAKEQIRDSCSRNRKHWITR